MRVKTHLDFRNAMFFTFQDYLPPDIELPQREQPLMQGLHEHVYRQKRYVHQMPKAHRAYLLHQEKNASSICTFHFRRVLIARSCAGAFREVTNAVRIGELPLSLNNS